MKIIISGWVKACPKCEKQFQNRQKFCTECGIELVYSPEKGEKPAPEKPYVGVKRPIGKKLTSGTAAVLSPAVQRVSGTVRKALAFFNLARIEPRLLHTNELILFSGIWFLVFYASVIPVVMSGMGKAFQSMPFIPVVLSFTEEYMNRVSPIPTATFFGVSLRTFFLLIFPLFIGLYIRGHKRFYSEKGFYTHKKGHILFSLVEMGKEQVQTRTDFVRFTTVSFFYGLFLVITYLPVYITRKLAGLVIYWLEYIHNILTSKKIAFIVLNKRVGNREVIMRTLASIKEIFPELELKKVFEHDFSFLTSKIGSENFWKYLMLYEGMGVSIFLTDKGVSFLGNLYDSRLAYLVLQRINEDDFLESRNDLLMAVENAEKEKRRWTWERIKHAVIDNPGIPLEDMRKIIANPDYQLDDLVAVFDKFVA